jgi:hypothetical protein
MMINSSSPAVAFEKNYNIAFTHNQPRGQTAWLSVYLVKWLGLLKLTPLFKLNFSHGYLGQVVLSLQPCGYPVCKKGRNIYCTL